MARRARRTFTPEFMAKVVLDLPTGTATQAEVPRKHQLSVMLPESLSSLIAERGG
jgi:hypothetical protein